MKQFRIMRVLDFENCFCKSKFDNGSTKSILTENNFEIFKINYLFLDRFASDIQAIDWIVKYLY